MQSSRSPCNVVAMDQSGELRVSDRGQMSLPAKARHRWSLDDGGQVGYLDLGDSIIIVPGGVERLRATLFNAIDTDTWAQARAGFGDPDLASQ